jgi:hypothetical protein
MGRKLSSTLTTSIHIYALPSTCRSSEYSFVSIYVRKQCLNNGVDRDEPRLSVRYPPYTPANTQVLGVRSGAIEAPAAAL